MGAIAPRAAQRNRVAPPMAGMRDSWRFSLEGEDME